nr:10733_t:CDS:2 [Entrophospora candida]
MLVINILKNQTILSFVNPFSGLKNYEIIQKLELGSYDATASVNGTVYEAINDLLGYKNYKDIPIGVSPGLDSAYSALIVIKDNETLMFVQLVDKIWKCNNDTPKYWKIIRDDLFMSFLLVKFSLALSGDGLLNLMFIKWDVVNKKNAPDVLFSVDILIKGVKCCKVKAFRLKIILVIYIISIDGESFKFEHSK